MALVRAAAFAGAFGSVLTVLAAGFAAVFGFAGAAADLTDLTAGLAGAAAGLTAFGFAGAFAATLAAVADALTAAVMGAAAATFDWLRPCRALSRSPVSLLPFSPALPF